MPEDNDQEKTEPATPKKKEEARKKGQVARSMEIPSTLILLASLGVFSLGGSWMLLNLSQFMKDFFQNHLVQNPHNIQTMTKMLWVVLERSFLVLTPLMLAVLLAGVIANIIQVGFLMSGESMVPDLSKLDPISGMKGLFSLKSMVELVKVLIKVVVIGYIVFLTFKANLGHVPDLYQLSVSEIISFIGKAAFKISFYTCIAMIVLSIPDYAFQRWRYEEDLKMTKQEVKDELKQKEGDPAIKARIKRVQMEMAQKRMMEAVPQADVVITNPTHLAIAVKYDSRKMIAPKVIAKGAGYIAEKIKKIAEDKRIPVIENKFLARAMYKTVEIDEFIPVSFYKAVAEVLTYVYKLKGIKNI